MMAAALAATMPPTNSSDRQRRRPARADPGGRRHGLLADLDVLVGAIAGRQLEDQHAGEEPGDEAADVAADRDVRATGRRSAAG